MMDLIVSFIKLCIAFVHDVAGGNQWLTTAILAGAAFVLRSIPKRFFDFIVRQSTVTLRVTDKTPENQSETINAILLYLKKHSNPNFQRNYTVNDFAIRMDDRILAGSGSHWVTVRNSIILVRLSHVKNDNGETRVLILKMMFWNREKFKDILKDIYPKNYDIPFIYSMPEQGTPWLNQIGVIPELFGKQKQLIDNVLYNKIDSLVDRFISDDDFYTNNSRQRKETFLLYGPPGTGKTTLIRHLASKHNLPIILSNMSNLGRVLKAIGVDNIGKCIILIEDLTFPKPKSSDEPVDAPSASAGQFHFRLSKFLNELDGVNPLNDVMVFITTNKIETYPQAVYRPGRVDHLIHFNYPSQETVMSAIDIPFGDERYKYLTSLDISEIPLDNIVSIRNATSLEEVKQIITSKDDYLKLSLESAT